MLTALSPPAASYRSLQVVLSLQSPQVLGGWGGFNIISSVLVLVLLLFLSHKVRHSSCAGRDPACLDGAIEETALINDTPSTACTHHSPARNKVGRLESSALNVLTAVFAVAMTVTAIMLVVQQKGDLCVKIIDGTASTVQDLLVALYLLLAVALVASRAAVRKMAPWLAAKGCSMVAARITAREDADASDVVLARGVFSPPPGKSGLFC